MPKKMLAKLITTVTPVTEDTTLGAVTANAPDLAVDVDLALVLDDLAAVTVVTLLAALVEATTGVVAAAADETATAGVEAATVAAPLIAACTVLLKVPVNPSRVKIAENAVKGSVGAVGDM